MSWRCYLCSQKAPRDTKFETHHAFRGIEFPEAAKLRCLSASTPYCLRSGPGTLDRRPLTTTPPKHTTCWLWLHCIADYSYYSLLIAASGVHIALSTWFFNTSLRICQRHGRPSCPRVCVFLPRLRVPHDWHAIRSPRELDGD